MRHGTTKHEVVNEHIFVLDSEYGASMLFRNVDCLSKDFSITYALRTSKPIFMYAADITLYFQFPINLNTTRNKSFSGY
jgi:hypothetical protein